MCVAEFMRFLKGYKVFPLLILIISVGPDVGRFCKRALLNPQCIAGQLQAHCDRRLVAPFRFPLGHDTPSPSKRPRRGLTRSRRMKYLHNMKPAARKPIDTVAELVTAFGGTFALARWADVVPSTVSNWKEQNHIPPGWHLRLYLECENRNLKVSPKLFGLAGKGNGKPPRPSKGLTEPRFVEA
jgi:hypothetical protein